MKQFDAAVLGGGFYGCCIAIMLSQHYDNVVLIEKENGILKKASSINQARVHAGYHYPRSFMTAIRSLTNYTRFLDDFHEAIINEIQHLYAIVKYGSKVNAGQFYNTFKKIGAPIQRAPDTIIKKLFNLDLIDDVFIVNEAIFDWEILEKLILKKLHSCGVALLLNTEIQRVESFNDYILVHTNSHEIYHTDKVFSCLYSKLNNLQKNSNLPLLPLKYELAELALVKPLIDLEKYAITIMDGHFFSLLPYPQKKLYTLSHVRYTPHICWIDPQHPSGINPEKLSSHFSYMQHDAVRYMPLLKELKYIDSLYEIKTILQRNENDDGRPILFREEQTMKNFYAVMGSKIDNVYDVLDAISDKCIIKSDCVP